MYSYGAIVFYKFKTLYIFVHRDALCVYYIHIGVGISVLLYRATTLKTVF